MPTYEYQCAACGHQMEAFQKMSDAPLTDCPVCHKTALNKLISASGFQLKGSGWYATDYSKKKAKPTTESSGSETNTSEKPKDSSSSSSNGAS